MGTPEFAVPSLRQLVEAGHAALAVVTQPDRPVGRKQIMTPPPVKVFAEGRGIPVFQPVKLRTPEARSELEPVFKEPDVIVVAAYGRILPDWILDAPRYRCLNVHSSLLPKYRGAAPVNWAIASGETETGITIMQIETGLDAGPILLQRKTPIGNYETAAELTARLAIIGADLLVEALFKLEGGELTPTPQDESQATFAPLLKREDGEIDWQLSSDQIINRKRGFTPFPGCYTKLDGKRLEIVRASSEGDDGVRNAEDAARIIEIQRDSFVVQCGHRTRLRVTGVQPEGRRAMDVSDFLNGVELRMGQRLG